MLEYILDAVDKQDKYYRKLELPYYSHDIINLPAMVLISSLLVELHVDCVMHAPSKPPPCAMCPPPRSALILRMWSIIQILMVEAVAHVPILGPLVMIISIAPPRTAAVEPVIPSLDSGLEARIV